MTDVHHKSLEEFFVSSETCVVITVSEDLNKEARDWQEEELIDPVTLRAGQDWSYLGSQVVGAEIP